MKRSAHESDDAHRLPADDAAEATLDCSDHIVSDDEIPWDEIIKDARSRTRGYVFDPADYESDEDMMAAAEALLLKRAEEDKDEDKE